MRNLTEKILKAAFWIFLVFALFLTAIGQIGAQTTTYGHIGEKQYMLAIQSGQVRLALMSPTVDSEIGGYRIGDAKSINCAYEGTPAMVLEMIAEEYTLAGLSFPCFCDAIGASQTPAALQYYERCQEIRNFVNSLK